VDGSVSPHRAPPDLLCLADGFEAHCPNGFAVGRRGQLPPKSPHSPASPGPSPPGDLDSPGFLW
jgi:hypothetical protein